MKRGKKAQLEISFNMIFSILLIIAFIVVAIYAITFFLNLKKCADTGTFKDSLQKAVDNAWNSDSSNQVFKSNLPSTLQYVCFINLSESSKGKYPAIYAEFKKLGYINSNMFFYPTKNVCKGQFSFIINHLDLSQITKTDNPNCFKNLDRNIEIDIEKGFYDSKVKLK